MRKAILALAVAMLIPASSRAATITFVGPLGTPVATTAEGVFTYGTFSGGLFRDSQGNGDAFDMEGCSACNGGVLSIVRNDVAGGLFTFDAADIAYQFDGIYPISFSGYVSGGLVATDVFNTAAGSVYSTFASSALAGLQIDELRVQLDAAANFATVVDNVVVTPTTAPEPSILLLLGSGLFGVASRRRFLSRQ